MWKDAPAALCELVGVDPARKWAQCEKERDEWAALAGQYKRERDEARELAQQMSESNKVLLADIRYYRTAWEQLKEAAK